jgi:protein-tyrosine phosphatase
VVAAAFLLALGTTDDEIVADYALTGANTEAIGNRLRPVLAAVLADHGIRNAMAAAATEEQFSGAAMETALRTLRDRHGDPLAPLRAAGLSDGLIEALHRRAVAPGDARA